jgi:hypothetical protein
LSVFDMACLLVLAPLLSLSPAGQEHGRTIPLPEVATRTNERWPGRNGSSEAPYFVL